MTVSCSTSSTLSGMASPQQTDAPAITGRRGSSARKQGRHKHLSPVFRNAASNVVRGGTTALISLALPHFLSRYLNAERFAAWALLLQIAAYASFLDFGLQVAVSRFVAQATELGLIVKRLEVIRASLTLLLLTVAFALAVAAVIIWQAHLLFRDLPSGMLHEFRVAAAILTLSTGVQLIFGSYAGVLAGLHRNDLAAFPMALAKLAAAFVVVFAVRTNASLIPLALITALGILAGSFVQGAITLHLIRDIRIFLPAATRKTLLELLRFCRGLGVWSLSMLVISGLDLTILGHYDFRSVGTYAIAASVVGVISGLDNAILSSLIAPLSAFQARGATQQIREVMEAATLRNSCANLTLLFLVWQFGQWALHIWVGSVYAITVQPIVLVLCLAQCIRLVASPYSVALVACGLHAKGALAAFAEAGVNLAASLWLVQRHGAIGIAVGTLLGAIASLIVHTLYTIPRTPALHLNPVWLLRTGILSPILRTSPLLLYALWRHEFGPLFALWLLPLCLCTTVLTTLPLQPGHWLSKHLRKRIVLTRRGLVRTNLTW